MTWPNYLRRECTIAPCWVVPLSPQQTEVLAILLMRYPELVPEEVLIEALWPHPDYEPEAASMQLRAVVYQLRRRIGGFRISNFYRWGYKLCQRPQDATCTDPRRKAY